MYKDEILQTMWEDEAGKRSPFFMDGMLSVPPTVTVAFLPAAPQRGPFRWHHLGPVNAQGETPFLVYPLPEGWTSPMPDTVVREEDLMTSGWTWQRDSRNVFGDYLRLAEVSDGDMRTEAGCTRVVNFAKKWGPLWICRTPIHPKECYWQPAMLRPWTSRDTDRISLDRLRLIKRHPCQWLPWEEVASFVWKAREVRLIFEAIITLQHGDLVPESVWRRLGFQHAAAIAEYPRDAQRQLLFLSLYPVLEYQSTPRVRLRWDNGPKCIIVPGPGFIHGVFLTLAQLLCQARGVYQCDECGNLYVRPGKRPQTGKRNFCSSCGAKAAKRQWAQRQRHKGQTDDRQVDA